MNIFTPKLYTGGKQSFPSQMCAKPAGDVHQVASTKAENALNTAPEIRPLPIRHGFRLTMEFATGSSCDKAH